MKAAVRVKPPPERPGDVRLPAVVVRALATPGEPLGAEVRGEMEQRLGHDFGHVRIHAEARAAAAARALDSLAFTSGAHIVFAEGCYHPHTREGRRLLAHELVHTLQQRAPAEAVSLQSGGADPAVSLQVSASRVAAADPLEAEAAAVADCVAEGQAVPAGAVSLDAPSARGRIARQAREAIARAPREDSLEDIQAVADDVARLLLFDPQDTFGRVRRRLDQLVPETREAVAAALRGRVTGPAAARLDAILVELRPPSAGPPPLPEALDRPAPAVEPAAPEVERPSPIEALGRLWRTVVERLRPWRETSPVEAPEKRAFGPATAAPAEPTAAAAAPIEPPATATAAAEMEAPAQIAAAAVAGLTARDAAAAPAKAEPEAAMTPIAPGAAAKDAEPARRPAGTEETSESGEDVDPRVDDAAIGPEDAEDEAAAAEAAEATATVESPGRAVTQPTALESSAGPESPPATELPEAAASQADAAMPDLAPADADPAQAHRRPTRRNRSLPRPPRTRWTRLMPRPRRPRRGRQMLPGRRPPRRVRQSRRRLPPRAPRASSSRTRSNRPPKPVPSPRSGRSSSVRWLRSSPGRTARTPGTAGAAQARRSRTRRRPRSPTSAAASPRPASTPSAALPPTGVAVALGGVRAATTRSIGHKRGELAAAPPQLERPTGAPTRAEAAAEAPAPEALPRAPAKLERTPAGHPSRRRRPRRCRPRPLRRSRPCPASRSAARPRR